jgi:hypothetical protein
MKKPSVAISTDDLDEPQRSGYLADIEACQVYGCSQKEISPDDARKMYYLALDDVSTGKLEGMDAFRTPAMEQCKQALYGVCLRSTLFAGGTLDFQASLVYNAVRYSSAASVWFTRLVKLMHGVVQLLARVVPYKIHVISKCQSIPSDAFFLTANRLLLL